MKCVFALSADFGEYATANVLSRGQPIERRFLLPERLAPYAQGPEFLSYAHDAELEARLLAERPDCAVLSSGYLYAINGLFGPDALERLVARLRSEGIAVATTDPWLGLWRSGGAGRFEIRSIRQGALDEAQSRRVSELQRRLGRILGALPHLYAVPLDLEGCDCAFNPAFAAGKRARSGGEWLFVLSREDHAMLASPQFDRSLGDRIAEVLSLPRNRVRLVGPPALESAVRSRFASEPRFAFEPFRGFDAFEQALRGARIVVYWNVLSATLLYCLYYDVTPVFFGRGHQATVLPGLYDHVVRHVYRGRAPALLDGTRPLDPDPARLEASLDSRAWLAAIRRDFAALPALPELVRRWTR